MNATNGSSFDIGLTETEIWLQNLLFFIVLDIPSFIGNGFIFIAVIKVKTLKTFFFVLIAGHTFFRALLSLTLMLVGAYRIWRMMVPSILYITRYQCHTLHVLVYFCDSFNNMTLCIIAIDRLVAVAVPVKYHNFSAKLGFRFIFGLSLFVVLSKVIPSYLGSVPFADVIPCLTAFSPTPPFFMSYFVITNFMFGLASVILYCILNIAIRFRIKKIMESNRKYDVIDNQIQQLVKQQAKLLPLLNLLIIVNVFCAVSMELLMVIGSFFPPEIASRFVLYGSCLSVLDRTFDFMIMIWKSSELRQGIKTILPLKTLVQSF